MADPAADRTEPATPKRLDEARKKGQVAFSRDLSGTLVLAAAFLLAISPLGTQLALAVSQQAQSVWSGSEVRPETLGDFHALLLAHLLHTAWIATPFVLAIALAGLLGSFVQIGPLFSTEALSPDLNKLNPITGLKRLVAPERMMELVKNLVKLVLIIWILWTVMYPALGLMLSLFGAELGFGLDVTASLTRSLVVRLLVALLLLALLDVLWVRWRHQQRLKMTKQEVRDEMRQREGDPEVRQRLRSQLRLSHQRMIAEVAKADVVVRNPTHYAVALRYKRSEMTSPTVVAKGRNRVALRILEIAREHDVPIVENPPLARTLYRSTRVGREIPEALYEAVAELLAYVYRLDRQRASSWGVGS